MGVYRLIRACGGPPGGRIASPTGRPAAPLAATVVTATAALLLLGGCRAPDPGVPDRVLLVTIDTLRADHVGAYGDGDAHTPTLDTLAAGGVRFETAIAPTPLTLPSHTSLMTGLEPPRHAVRHNSIHRLAAGIPTLAESMRAAGYATAAFVGALVLERRFGLARGFDVYDDRMDRFSSRTVGFSERTADRVVDAALGWLAQAPPRFFLWVHLYDPHALYQPPPGFAAAFASRRYAGEIAFADHELGRLLAGVRERFGDAGLLVAATSDHGESLGEHGESTHAYGIYDATQRIPLILSGVGMPRGRVVDAPVRLLDLAPTLLAAAGAAPLPDAAGRDLGPWIAGAGAPADGPGAAYLETFATWYDYGWSPLVGLRTADTKYVRAPRPELYDLARDPDELENLAASAPARVAALEEALEARLPRRRRESVGVELAAADRERLRSLGYVVPDDPAATPGPVRWDAPDPKDQTALLRRVAAAEGKMFKRRYEEGWALLRDLEAPPVHVRALRAAAAQNAGRHAEAARDARRVTEQEPRRLDGHLILGHALEAQGDLEGARAAFETATGVDPRSDRAWEALARVAAAQGDEGAAADARARAQASAQHGETAGD